MIEERVRERAKKKERTKLREQSCQECSQTPYFVGKNVKFFSTLHSFLFLLTLLVLVRFFLETCCFYVSYIHFCLLHFITILIQKLVMATKSWRGERKMWKNQSSHILSSPYHTALVSPLSPPPINAYHNSFTILWSTFWKTCMNFLLANWALDFPNKQHTKNIRRNVPITRQKKY